jgi:hypothetical protein
MCHLWANKIYHFLLVAVALGWAIKGMKIIFLSGKWDNSVGQLYGTVGT